MKKEVKTNLIHSLPILYLLLTIIFISGCATVEKKPPPVPAPKVEVPKEEVPVVKPKEEVPVAAPPKPAPPIPNTRVFPDFIALIAQEGDTLSSLADKYLKDASMDWFIADFNDISTLSPGEALIIPLKPYERGGLSAKGYQIVPVLSYHQFSKTVKNKMTVTEADFEEQMKFLKDDGYRVITLDQLFDFLDFKIQIPKKSVVITIDDGWRSVYDIAYPILKKYGYPATLFIYTDLITGGEKTLSWDLIDEMVKSGLIDLQCHSKTHRNLTILDKKETFPQYFESILENELKGCRSIVKRRLNRDVKYFAYPYGDTNHLVVGLLRKLGYRGAFTVKRWGNPFFIHNYRVNRSMIYGDYDLSQFRKNLDVFNRE